MLEFIPKEGISRMNKKIISILLVSSMAFSMTACGNEAQDESSKKPATQTTTAETTAETTVAETEPEAESVSADTESLMGFNMIENPDFSSEDLKWGTYFEGGAGELKINSDGELQFDSNALGSKEHSNQIFYDGFKLVEGAKYRMQFDIRASEEREVCYRIQINGGDYHAYNEEYITVKTEPYHFDTEFEMTETSDPAPRLCFNLGKFKNSPDLGKHSIYIDNFDFQCVDESNKKQIKDTSVEKMILVDQIGYRPGDVKQAVLWGEGISKNPVVVNAATNVVVYNGSYDRMVQNSATGRLEALFDFSEVKEPGKYKIQSGGQESFEFEIKEDVYKDALAASVKMLSLQRCGCELSKDLAGQYAHPACHTEKAKIYGTNKKIDVSGGWHDAGDYGRYVVSGAKAACDLMLAYENNPESFNDNLGIPESGNMVPDLLDEARYEIEWLFKMQNKEGGVYHKVTCANFPGFVMPEEETDELIVCPVSSTATGDFAATMAMAARIYKQYDPEFAQKCLDAAEKSADFLSRKYTFIGAKNPKDIVTGEYPDNKDQDERFWAYAELFRTTGNEKYDKMAQRTKPEGFGDLGWQGVAGYGAFAYLKSNSSGVFKSTIQEQFDKAVNDITDYASKGTNKVSVTHFNWGSNMGVANNAMLMLLHDNLSGSSENNDLAMAQLHYLFGNNGTAYCFLTGFGSLSPEQTHHRPSQAKGETMPGMLVGGPNQDLEDPFVASVCNGKPAALCYVDNSQSYSTNETAVYWNSPLAYLLAYANK